MKTEPRMWRKQRDGKAYGCWWVTVNRNDVNLNTKSAEIARGRLAEALGGKTKGWPSDAELAAQAMDLRPAPAGAPAPGQTAPSTSGGAPAAAAGPPLVPDDVAPPATNGNTGLVPPLGLPAIPQGTASSEQSARDEAEATNAAAAETAGKTANDNAGAAGPGFALGADAIRGLLAQAGAGIVELQLGLQAWLVFKRTGKIAPPVDPDSPIRKCATDAWVAQFEVWFPNMDTVPPWILAVGLPAMALPIQFMAAQPPPPETRPAGETPPTETPVQQPTEQAAA